MPSPVTAMIRNEWNDVGIRRPIAPALTCLLPAHAFARTRNTIYKAAGFSGLSRTTVWFGAARLTGSRQNRHRLVTGDVVRFNVDCLLNVEADITIGDNVGFGHEVMILTESHEIGHAGYRSGARYAEPVRIGSGCWIGARTTILPGVTIGDGCVVGAGSLVTSDIPPNTVAAGSPARVVRELGPEPALQS